MRDIPITEFRKMLVKEVKDTGSFNLIADGEFVAVVVIPASGEKKFQFQALAQQGNTALGKD